MKNVKNDRLIFWLWRKIGAILTERREKGTTATGQAIELVVYEIRKSVP